LSQAVFDLRILHTHGATSSSTPSDTFSSTRTEPGSFHRAASTHIIFMPRAAWAAIDHRTPTRSSEVKNWWHFHGKETTSMQYDRHATASFVIDNRSPVHLIYPSCLSRCDLFGIPAPSIRQRERKMGRKYDDQPRFRHFVVGV